MAVGELGGHHKKILIIYFADEIPIYVYLYSIVYDGIITPRCFGNGNHIPEDRLQHCRPSPQINNGK